MRSSSENCTPGCSKNEKTAMIYIVDPNNPVGTTQTAQEIEEIAA